MHLALKTATVTRHEAQHPACNLEAAFSALFVRTHRAHIQSTINISHLTIADFLTLWHSLVLLERRFGSQQLVVPGR